MTLLQGLFKPKNPNKYAGNTKNIVYRSSWELTCMQKFDSDPNVIYWASEEVAVPYVSPKDNRIHRYYPDFIVKRKLADDSIKTFMLEVKRQDHVDPPKPGKSKQRYLLEALQWGVNQAKWKAAKRFCHERNWEFAVLTEKTAGFK